MSPYKLLLIAACIGFCALGKAYPVMDIESLSAAASPLSVQEHPALLKAYHQLLDNKSNTAKALGKHDLMVVPLLDSFSSHNIPAVLTYGPLSLSGYNVWKVSEDGGSGYWQMRYLLAKEHNLKINSYVDERRDMAKASRAVQKELIQLYSEFQDWTLAYLALQTGAVEVNKAIRKANGKTNYWEIHPFLLPRYQSVVPSLLAAIYVSQKREQLEIEEVLHVQNPHDTVYVDRWCTIFQMSKALNIDFELLKDLNPIYKKQVIPQSDIPKPLVIPSTSLSRYYDLGDSIYTYNAVDSTNIKLPKHEVVGVPEGQKPKTTSSGNKLLYYTVRKGDYLGRIADLYDVRISDIRRWNGIRGDQIQVNQRLKIYKPSSVYSRYKGINSMSANQKQNLINKD